mgnify:CR=1 FL=1
MKGVKNGKRGSSGSSQRGEPTLYDRWKDEAEKAAGAALGGVGQLCCRACVLVLDVTEDAVSYGLKLLRTAGLVVFRTRGRVVYYRLAPEFPHDLADHCLRQLLTIVTESQR